MKVISISASDSYGGAAKATYRIHKAVIASQVDSRLFVSRALSGDYTVMEPEGRFYKYLTHIKANLANTLVRALRTTNTVLHSPALLPSHKANFLNQSDMDLVHLHWINGEMLSLVDIGRIKKPVVWTLHDMWAFCGAEHYTEDFRWRDGYQRVNRPSYESGFDLNRWTWVRKQKHWQKPFQIVTPSHWLAGCVRASALMGDWPVVVIPNALDMAQWQPVNKMIARELLGLPCDVPILLFGAMGGGEDPRKGFDLLQDALSHLRDELSELQLLVFGQLPPRDEPDIGFPIHYTGHLHDELSLRILYSAADLLVIPSRQDNLPNTGVEALACATPVVAFDTCGLPDIVDHKKNGYLATAFDTGDLAAGIKWVLNNDNGAQLSAAAREKAVNTFDSKLVAQQYIDLYQEVLSR